MVRPRSFGGVEHLQLYTFSFASGSGNRWFDKLTKIRQAIGGQHAYTDEDNAKAGETTTSVSAIFDFL